MNTKVRAKLQQLKGAIKELAEDLERFADEADELVELAYDEAYKEGHQEGMEEEARQNNE